MQTKNINYIFINPLTQSFGEMLFDNSSESITLTYEEIISEITKMQIINISLIHLIKDKLKIYEPFVIDCYKQKLLFLKENKKEIKNNKTKEILENKIRKDIKKKYNPNSIKNVKNKLNNILNKQNPYNNKNNLKKRFIY